MSDSRTKESLPALVKARFNAALDSGAITFWPTEVKLIYVHGLPFQLRYCPSLASKPKSDKPGDHTAFDPFLDPPEAMLITQLSPSHVLVLNKFAIVREHFILATKSFKKQTDLLEVDDLSSTFACLKQWQIQGKSLFAFFNSGEHSGASQPHRHIQLLPVEAMMDGLKDGLWKPAIDLLASDSSLGLPFLFYSAAVPKNPTPEELYGIYLALYNRTCRAVATYNTTHEEQKYIPRRSNQDSISYNLGLTSSSMIMCPRRAEGVSFSSTGDTSHLIGPISLNGTVLAGTLLVKHEQEWEALKRDPSKLSTVLSFIGIPSGHQNATSLTSP